MSTNRIICILDDDADITLLFHDILYGITGVTVLKLSDPILSLRHFQVNEQAYVLVISDYKMSGLIGMEFLKRIKDLNQSVRTILMTEFQIDDKVFLDYSKEKIINAILQKPIGMDDLLKEVDTQLHSYELQRRFPS